MGTGHAARDKGPGALKGGRHGALWVLTDLRRIPQIRVETLQLADQVLGLLAASRQLHNMGPSSLGHSCVQSAFKSLKLHLSLTAFDPFDHMGPCITLEDQDLNYPQDACARPHSAWSCHMAVFKHPQSGPMHWCRHLSARSTVDGANICQARGSWLPFCGTTMLHNIDSGGLIQQPKEPFCH